MSFSKKDLWKILKILIQSSNHQYFFNFIEFIAYYSNLLFNFLFLKFFFQVPKPSQFYLIIDLFQKPTSKEMKKLLLNFHNA